MTSFLPLLICFFPFFFTSSHPPPPLNEKEIQAGQTNRESFTMKVEKSTSSTALEPAVGLYLISGAYFESMSLDRSALQQ